MQFNLELLPAQALFLEDTTTRDLAQVGGRGCGKTFSLATKLVTLSAIHAGCTGAALSPTGPMASKVLIPDLLDACDRLAPKRFKFNKSERRLDIKWGSRLSHIYVLSAENVRDGLGLNLAYFGVDEADTIEKSLALDSWRKLSGALRAGNPKHRQKVAVSTPEGFGSFMYQHWVKDVLEARLKLESGAPLTEQQRQDLEQVVARRIITGRTLDNPYITADVIADLRATYPAHFLDAYLEGKFVNLTSGSIYPDFDPVLNGTDLTIQNLPSNVHTLHLGIDFNVVNPKKHPYGIACVVAAIINDAPYFIDEVYGFSRTQDLVNALRSRYPGKQLIAYPDATAEGLKTSASVSDREQLRAAGFTDASPIGNPRVIDRVNSVQALILNGNGVRRLRVNPTTCPVVSSCLQHQAWDEDTDEPQKGSGFDDVCDAVGYLCNVRWPIKRNNLETGSLRI